MQSQINANSNSHDKVGGSKLVTLFGWLIVDILVHIYTEAFLVPHGKTQCYADNLQYSSDQYCF